MSTLQVSYIQTANGSTNLSITTGNTSASKIVLDTSGNISFGNSSSNTMVVNSTMVTITGNINDGGANTQSQTLTDAATISWNIASGRIATVTLAGNRTFANATNIKVGSSFILFVKQDGTGSRTLTWATGYKWPSGTPPTLTATANATDIIRFVSDGIYLYGTTTNNLS